MPNYKELVELIVRRLVTKPEEVTVEQQTSEGGAVLVKIRVARDDTGRVIGKRGATINSLRHIVKAASIKVGEKIDVDIVDDYEEEKE